MDQALTTSDNPYSPFALFDEWNSFDQQKGYNTCAYLARIACTSNDMSDADNELESLTAMEEIVHYNLTGLYEIVEKNDYQLDGLRTV